MAFTILFLNPAYAVQKGKMNDGLVKKIYLDN